MNITNDVRPRLKHHFATLYRALHSTVHNHSLSGDASDDLGSGRDDELSAMQVALYLTIDLDQAFCGHIAYNLQSVTDDCSTSP